MIAEKHKLFLFFSYMLVALQIWLAHLNAQQHWYESSAYQFQTCSETQHLLHRASEAAIESLFT